jgi:hypothetical protein
MEQKHPCALAKRKPRLIDVVLDAVRARRVHRCPRSAYILGRCGERLKVALTVGVGRNYLNRPGGVSVRHSSKQNEGAPAIDLVRV